MPKKTQSKEITPPALSRERILMAAIELADEQGIDSLSMRKLADQLGVKAMSLYNHVTNKEDVLDGMVDIVAGKIQTPSLNGNWKEAMRKRAISAHAVLVKHPWASMLMLSRINIGPAMLNYVNATIGCLNEAGFSLPMADHIWNTLDSYIYGFSIQELNFPIDPSEYAKTAQDYLPIVPAEQYPYLNAMAHQVIDGTHQGIHEFTFGLDLILDSMERLREES